MTTIAPNHVTELPRDAARRGFGGGDPQTRIAQIHVAAVAIVVGCATLWLLSDVLLLLFAATLIACQLHGAAEVLRRRCHVPYALGLAIVVLLIGASLGAVSIWRGPRLLSELYIVASQINDQVSRLWADFGHVAWLQHILERAKLALDNKGGVLAGTAAGFVTSSIGNLGSLLLVAVASIYLAASPAIYENGIVRLLPKGWRTRACAVMAQEASTLQRWFLGQLVDMLAIGLMIGFGLWLLGVPLYLTLALIAALFNFVPYLGALAGSLPAIVVALGVSPHTALWVVALFVIVQTIEGNLISPLISHRTVDMPPVLTLFSQTVLGSLFGPFGLILATPITAAVMVLVQMVYVETILGDA